MTALPKPRQNKANLPRIVLLSRRVARARAGALPARLRALSLHWLPRRSPHKTSGMPGRPRRRCGATLPGRAGVESSARGRRLGSHNMSECTGCLVSRVHPREITFCRGEKDYEAHQSHALQQGRSQRRHLRLGARPREDWEGGTPPAGPRSTHRVYRDGGDASCTRPLPQCCRKIGGPIQSTVTICGQRMTQLTRGSLDESKPTNTRRCHSKTLQHLPLSRLHLRCKDAIAPLSLRSQASRAI